MTIPTAAELDAWMETLRGGYASKEMLPRVIEGYKRLLKVVVAAEAENLAMKAWINRECHCDRIDPEQGGPCRHCLFIAALEALQKITKTTKEQLDDEGLHFSGGALLGPALEALDAPMPEAQ